MVSVYSVDETEFQELSSLLTAQKTTHDQIKNNARRKRQRLEELLRECEAAEAQVYVNKKGEMEKDPQSVGMMNALDVVKMKISDAVNDNATYAHMLKRLVQEKSELDMTMEQLQYTLEATRNEFDTCQQTYMKAQQAQSQAETEKQLLQTEHDDHRRLRRKRLDESRHAAEDQSRLLSRREERMHRRKEIALQVSAELGEEEEQFVQKNLDSKSAYEGVVTRRLELLETRYSNLTEGFMKIHNATGLTEVNDIVNKYLTRDQAFESLQKATEDTQIQIEVVKKECEALRGALDETQVSGALGSGSRVLYKEITDFETNLTVARKEFYELERQMMKTNMQVEDIKQTVGKLVSKMRINLGGGGGGGAGGGGETVITDANLGKAWTKIESHMVSLVEAITAQMAKEEQHKTTKTKNGDKEVLPVSGGDIHALFDPNNPDNLYKTLTSTSQDISARNVRVDNRLQVRTPSPTPLAGLEAEEEDDPLNDLDRDGIKKISGMLLEKAGRARASNRGGFYNSRRAVKVSSSQSMSTGGGGGNSSVVTPQPPTR